MAKKNESKVLERVYTVPLRKGFMKAPRTKRAKKAVKVLKEFLKKHMKCEEVKILKELNECLWSRGIQKPPARVKVRVVKSESVCEANLYDLPIKKEEPSKEKHSEEKKEAKEKASGKKKSSSAGSGEKQEKALKKTPKKLTKTKKAKK